MSIARQDYMNRESINPEELLEEIQKRYGLTTEDIFRISLKFKPLQVKKGSLFSEKGKICQHVGLLVDGVMYAYYESGGKEHISRFFYHPANFVVSSFESFSKRTSSNETIVAVEDSLLSCISFEDLQALYEEFPKMNEIGREIAQYSYIMAMRRVHSMQALGNQERVEKFFHEQPSLFNRVQNQHIASYLSVNRGEISKLFKRLRIR
jgi:CRP-like cAMP-binding protein